jgi:hypothetical protein
MFLRVLSAIAVANAVVLAKARTHYPRWF